MRISETAKFKKQRKRLKSKHEREALKAAVVVIADNPGTGKKLKGELRDLMSYRYTVQGQERRLVYEVGKEHLALLSFGPRGSIYQ